MNIDSLKTCNMKKALIIGNDSLNAQLYDEVYMMYVESLNAMGFEHIDFAFTSIHSPFSDEVLNNTDSEILPDLIERFNGIYNFSDAGTSTQNNKFLGHKMQDYDFVFISTFTVDVQRPVYKYATYQTLLDASESEALDSRAKQKLIQNAKLIKLADIATNCDVNCVIYTFDPMIDMFVTTHTMFSFLSISDGARHWEKFDILSCIENKDIKLDREIDLLIAYNENLPFLAYDTYDSTSRRTITNALIDTDKRTDIKLLYNVNKFSTKAGIDRKYTFGNAIGELDKYALRKARSNARYSILMPNYDGMTISYRRLFEDLADGLIPLIPSHSEDSKFLIETSQLPQKLKDIYAKHNLYFLVDRVNNGKPFVPSKDSWLKAIKELRRWSIENKTEFINNFKSQS